MLAVQHLASDLGRSPYGREIGMAIGITGKGEIERLLKGLQERGFIARAKFRKASISILKRIDA
jgi:SOS-response transcriptional repressor LexA